MIVKWISGNTYQITAKVYRDCFNGIPQLDNPAFLTVFDANGNVIRLAFSQSNPKLSQEGLIIGRDSKSCDLCINDQSVSRRHAKLSKRGENILIEDLDSTNGIQINGRPLKPGSSSELPFEGEIQIGAVNLSVGRH